MLLKSDVDKRNKDCSNYSRWRKAADESSLSRQKLSSQILIYAYDIPCVFCLPALEQNLLVVVYRDELRKKNLIRFNPCFEVWKMIILSVECCNENRVVLGDLA